MTVLRGRSCHACAERARNSAHEPVSAVHDGQRKWSLTSTVTSDDQSAAAPRSV
jgi:hypothetical protein